MKTKILGLLAMGLLAESLAANAQTVTYDFTGVITSAAYSSELGTTISGTYTFTYNNTDTITGTRTSFAISSSGTPGFGVFASDIGGISSLPIPYDDPSGASNVTWDGTGLVAYQYAEAYPASSYLVITGHTPSPFNAAGNPVNLLSMGATAFGGEAAGAPFGDLGDTGFGPPAGGIPLLPTGTILANVGIYDVQYTIKTLTLAAPEIDPVSAASGLALLLGSLVALRARHPSNRVVT
jgi:hypothetical protein